MTKHQINFTPDGNKRMAIQAVPILSPVMLKRFEVYGGQIVAAIIRIGTLTLFTKDDQESANKIKEWVRECLSDFRTEHNKISDYLEEQRKNDSVDLVKGFTQEPFSIDFPYNHPIANRFVECIKDVDEQQITIEKMYFSGVIDDEQFDMAKKQAVRPLNHMLDRIYTATNVAKRTGGKFDPVAFINLLKNQVSVADLIVSVSKPKKPEPNVVEVEVKKEGEAA